MADEAPAGSELNVGLKPTEEKVKDFKTPEAIKSSWKKGLSKLEDEAKTAAIKLEQAELELAQLKKQLAGSSETTETKTDDKK